MKGPHISQMWDDCVKTIDGGTLPFWSFYRPGLVSKVGREYVKDSADGLGILDLGDGQLEIVPTEVKSRVAVNTFIRERMSLETNLGVDVYSPTKRHYRFLKSSEIKKWIPSFPTPSSCVLLW